MSKLLLNEKPLLILPLLAKKIGLNEAVILQQIHYCLGISNNEFDGRKWTYGSYKYWKENHFPWWSDKTIQRIFESLDKKGLILIGNNNKKSWDHTNWYSINYEKLAEIENSNQNTCPIDEDKLTISAETNCLDDQDKLTKGSGQIDQSNTLDFPKSSSETSTKKKTLEPPSTSGAGFIPDSDLKKLEDLNRETTGKMIASPNEIEAMKKALNIMSVDTIIALVKLSKQHYKPKFEGDKISTFTYFLPIIFKAAAAEQARSEPLNLPKENTPVTPEQLEESEKFFRDIMNHIPDEAKEAMADG
jgi:hypothetical protein